MKNKVLLILTTLICSVILVSCYVNTNQQETRDRMFADNVQEITYKGHKYIFYSSDIYKAGLCHDPDCPCLKKDSIK